MPGIGHTKQRCLVSSASDYCSSFTARNIAIGSLDHANLWIGIGLGDIGMSRQQESIASIRHLHSCHRTLLPQTFVLDGTFQAMVGKREGIVGKLLLWRWLRVVRGLFVRHEEMFLSLRSSFSLSVGEKTGSCFVKWQDHLA